MNRFEIPSPPLEWAVLNLGPLPIRVYALAILTGIVVAVLLTRMRWRRRGGDPMVIEEIVLWAVPFGIVGGRLYHVISTPRPYFGEGGEPLDALKIWEGGLGIWGAIALGSLGAYIGARRVGVSFPAFMDAAAPGILLAQAIGRLGNYFNHELFGGPTTLPWGLRIDPESPSFPREYPPETLFHPTFLYEMAWSLIGVALLIYLDRKHHLRFGRAFWLYVIFYTSGRLWIEMVRIDTAEKVLGQRVNVWVALLVLLIAVAAFLLIGRKHRGEPVDPAPAAAGSGKAAAQAPAKAVAPPAKASAKASAPKAKAAEGAAPKAKAPARKTGGAAKG